MSESYFITGTDTNVGKTVASCALMHAFAALNRTVIGMKPVAAGCENGTWRDVELLTASSNVSAPRKLVNPYALAAPLSPHIAAKKLKIEIDLTVIYQSYHQLSKIAEVTIIEGVGGFRVPLSDKLDGSDLAQTLGVPVILIVGMRLGCLNHALLTAQAIGASGQALVGWIANCIDPQILALEANIQTLVQRLDCPLLGILPFDQNATVAQFSKLLDITKLLGTPSIKN